MALVLAEQKNKRTVCRMTTVIEVKEALRGLQGVERVFLNHQKNVEVVLNEHVHGIRSKVVGLLQTSSISLAAVHIVFSSDHGTDPEITAMLKGLQDAS